MGSAASGVARRTHSCASALPTIRHLARCPRGLRFPRERAAIPLYRSRAPQASRAGSLPATRVGRTQASACRCPKAARGFTRAPLRPPFAVRYPPRNSNSRLCSPLTGCSLARRFSPVGRAFCPRRRCAARSSANDAFACAAEALIFELGCFGFRTPSEPLAFYLDLLSLVNPILAAGGSDASGNIVMSPSRSALHASVFHGISWRRTIRLE
jgi:hypothetical protein